jgi:LysM repeat protein
MSLASLFAKTIVKASDNVFDAQKVKTQIEAPVAGINEAVPFTSNDQVEYAQKVVRSLITGESPKFSNKEKTIDPDGAIYNSLDEMMVGQLPELRYARYYKVADKDVELEEADQAVVEYYKDIISAKKEARLLSETAIQSAAENVVKNIKKLPEYERFVSSRLPKKVSVEDEPITKITNRDVAEQEFLQDSIETDYVYRATDIGADREYDLRFPFPAEISTHVGGDMGQANFMAIQKIFGDDARDMVLSEAKFVSDVNADGFPVKKRIIPEKSLNKFFAMRQAFTRMGWNPTELDLDKNTFDDIARTLQLNEVEEMAMLRSATSFNNVVMNKGRVNIKNPLDLKDQGWTPDEFNADPQQWVNAVAEQTGFSVEEILADPAYIDLRSEIKGSSAFVQDLINGNTINFLTDSLEGLRNAQLSLKIKDWLESYGFDSIRYTNAFEPSVPEGSGYSYVLFQPEQFKSATAVRFDPTDPRFTAAEGGFIGMVKKFFDSNQEVEQPKTRTVAKGDTLAKIAKETGISVADLQKFNDIKDPNKIQAGQSLRFEPKGGTLSSIRKEAIRQTKKTFDDFERTVSNTIPTNARAFGKFLLGNLLGLESKGGDIDVGSLGKEQQEVLKQAMANAEKKGRKYVTYDDYPTMADGQAVNDFYNQKRQDTNLVDLAKASFTDPVFEMFTSLGAFNFTKDSGGNYEVLPDRYDFNKSKSTAQDRANPKDDYSKLTYLGQDISEDENAYGFNFKGRINVAKGGKIDKKKMKCNKPKRTPSHPKKSHVVKACKDGKEKIIRFGEQGAKTAGKPKAGESARMKAKRKSFKARHRKNIKRGNMSAAYWADKVKW